MSCIMVGVMSGSLIRPPLNYKYHCTRVPSPMHFQVSSVAYLPTPHVGLAIWWGRLVDAASTTPVL